MKFKHSYCKEAMKIFGRMYPSRIGSPLPSILYNSASLSLREEEEEGDGDMDDECAETKEAKKDKEATNIVKDSETKIVKDNEAKIVLDKEAKIVKDKETKIVKDNEAKIVKDKEAKMKDKEKKKDKEAKSVKDKEARIVFQNKETKKDKDAKTVKEKEAKIVKDMEPKILLQDKGNDMMVEDKVHVEPFVPAIVDNMHVEGDVHVEGDNMIVPVEPMPVVPKIDWQLLQSAAPSLLIWKVHH